MKKGKGLLRGKFTFGRTSRRAKSGRATPDTDAGGQDDAVGISSTTPAQLVLVNELCERSKCTVQRAIEMLLIADWVVEDAAALQAKLAEADKALELEQAALHEQELDIYVGKFEEAVMIDRKMAEMRRALETETEELQAQKLRDEIERKEAALFPEPEGKEALESDACDAFSKEMIKNGLRHITQSGSDIQIKHHMLPPELDFGSMVDFPEAEPESSTPPTIAPAVTGAGLARSSGTARPPLAGVAEDKGDADPAPDDGKAAAAAATVSGGRRSKSGALTPESARRMTKNSLFPRETVSPFRPAKLNRRRSQSFSNLELLIDLNASDPYSAMPGTGIDLLGGLNMNAAQSMHDLTGIF